MNQLRIFDSAEFGRIRTVEFDGRPYFVANDVAKVLGYANPSKATNDHCKKAVMTWGNDSLGRRQEFKIVPEGDVYRLICHSKLPAAERFERWVFEEVLPSIRANGGDFCVFYTSDAAGEEDSGDIGWCPVLEKKKNSQQEVWRGSKGRDAA